MASWANRTGFTAQDRGNPYNRHVLPERDNHDVTSKVEDSLQSTHSLQTDRQESPLGLQKPVWIRHVDQELAVMLSGLYSAGTAMDASARQHDLIAQNLAHAQMPGYRRQMVRHGSFESQYDDEMKSGVAFQALGTNSQDVMTDFTQGALEKTGHNLDVALQGQGFFVVEGPEGPLYTRNGVFQLDDEGRLVTADYLPVQGKGGSITLPPDVSAATIRINGEGKIYAGTTEVGQLDIVNFNDPQKLKLQGVTLYKAPDDMPPEDAEAECLQGTRERSNVSPIQELVDLIAAQRRQEAAQKSMSLLSESIGKHIGSQGGV
ncbi:flagellar hook-basal body protein [Planctomicrobium piriforme]|uniref:Flagellar basal-body rod protein FlgG n=1 Tax=Planctomicrobium piriforme TaxID=1576369 RepID=A0A1I3HLP9_9PLAN|nr:flagellar hook basal-body protein [Planctomicrobium piriforme]SFI36563.1 flagellar basal-body rod protein FlgG [Planctomicrobium piriforme]